MIGKRTRGLTLKDIVFSDDKISRRTSSGFESKPACVGAEAFQGVTCHQKAAPSPQASPGVMGNLGPW